MEDDSGGGKAFSHVLLCNLTAGGDAEMLSEPGVLVCGPSLTHSSHVMAGV